MKTWDLETVEVWLSGPVPANGIDIARLAEPDERNIPKCVERFKTTLTSRGEVMSLAMLSGLRMHAARVPTKLVWNHHRILYEWSPKTTGVFNRDLPIPDESFTVWGAPLNYTEIHLDKSFLIRHGDTLTMVVEPAADVKHFKIDLFGVLLDPRSGKPWPDDFEPDRVAFEWDRGAR